MMFKKRIEVCFLFLVGICLSVLFSTSHVSAEEKQLPTGDILIIYSDDISDSDMDNVMELVKELTYQSFQVTFASASECLGQLYEYHSIVCYKIERFPQGLIEELQEQEKEGNRILLEREEAEHSNGENDIQLLFIGNSFLRTYLQQTGRKNDYIDCDKQVGKLQYTFGTNEEKQALVKEEDFLFLTGETAYSAGTVTADDIVGYFCARLGALTHICVSDMSDELVRAAASQEMSRWKWPYDGDPHIYAQYMVLNKVYPFQNPDKLLEIVNYMVKKKEPFVITVMPVYNHGNYPVMQHFCEVLRYAQANGGVILLHSPIDQMVEFDEDLVNEYITTAVEIYMDQGVYPMGLQVPSNWLFNSSAIQVISRFRTVMVEADEDAQITADKDARSNFIYRDGHQWIAPAILLDAEGAACLKTYSSAVYFDITDEMDLIERKVQACITSEVPLKSLWDIEHSFWTDEDVMTYRNHILLVNGKRTENTFTPTEYDENFQYNRNMLQRFSKDLSSENQKLIVVVLIVSGIFVWFILTARHRNKQRFFIRDTSGQLPDASSERKTHKSSRGSRKKRREKKNRSEDGMTEKQLEEMLEKQPKQEDDFDWDISDVDDFEHWDEN